MLFNDELPGSSNLYTENDYSNCFSDLKKDGKIFLIGCRSGKGIYNIAQKIANDAQRIVVAPIKNIRSYLITFQSLENMTLFHPDPIPEIDIDTQGDAFRSEEYRKSNNLFREFHPQNSESNRVSECQDL